MVMIMVVVVMVVNSDDHGGGDDDYPTEKVQQTPKPPAQVPFKVHCLNSIPFIFKFLIL